MAYRESREEEYLRRLKALGYEPSLAGMDDEDIEWELNKMDEAGRRQAPPQPTRTVYRPVDPGLAARIFRQMGRPYDPQAISPKQSFYLNGWDDGEDEEEEARAPVMKLPDFKPRQDGAGENSDPWAEAWRPDWGEGGNPLRTMEYRPARDGVPRTRTMEFRVGRDEGRVVPLSNEAANTTGNGAASAAATGGQADAVSAAGRAGRVSTGNGNSYGQYNQDWYDSNIWTSPEVLSSRTRGEIEAAINKIINSEAGEGLRQNYIRMHGNENDAEIARNNDVKYIVNSMDFNNQYAAHVREAQAKNIAPVARDLKQQNYDKNGTLERQYLGSGVLLDMAGKTKAAAALSRAMGGNDTAATLDRVGGAYEEQAKVNPDWQVNKQLYDRMNDAKKLIGKYLKAKDIVIKKDPLGENKFRETIRGWIGL